MPLAELLVALSLLGLVFAATTPLLQHVVQAFHEGAARVESQQSARLALERLGHDVRGAGYGGAAFAAVAQAEPTRLVLQSDLNGDGVIAGTGEVITWRLASGVLRRDAGGGAQPVVDGVQTLRFTYLDAAGAVTTAPAAVSSVRIVLTTRPARVAGAATAGLLGTFATTVRLRNR